MSFSPEWLALRESADHRSRDGGLTTAVAAYLGRLGRTPDIVDIGCGTGSNLRALSPDLGPQQRWTLIDYDRILLAKARIGLSAWADTAEPDGDHVLKLTRRGKTLHVTFEQADLVRDFHRVFQPTRTFDLLTASAFFDLASPNFIDKIAEATVAHRAAFYTVLTYNGINTWTPPHAADGALLEAFNTDQRTDKGLMGVAAGPDAPTAIVKSFERRGFEIAEAETPWVLSTSDAALMREFVPGFASACLKTGRVDQCTVEEWRARERTGALVGHVDTFAWAQ